VPRLFSLVPAVQRRAEIIGVLRSRGQSAGSSRSSDGFGNIHASGNNAFLATTVARDKWWTQI
jgi:hypothetical protein